MLISVLLILSIFPHFSTHWSTRGREIPYREKRPGPGARNTKAISKDYLYYVGSRGATRRGNLN